MLTHGRWGRRWCFYSNSLEPLEHRARARARGNKYLLFLYSGAWEYVVFCLSKVSSLFFKARSIVLNVVDVICNETLVPEDGSKAQFQRHNPLPPLLAFSLCGCVWWQSLSRFQPFTFYFNSIWKKNTADGACQRVALKPSSYQVSQPTNGPTHLGFLFLLEFTSNPPLVCSNWSQCRHELSL